jgi:hypothetical protein
MIPQSGHRFSEKIMLQQKAYFTAPPVMPAMKRSRNKL